MKRKLLLPFLGLLLLAGCQREVPVEPTPTVETVKVFKDEYPGVPEDNVFYYTDQTGLINMLEHGTGIVYLGFPECPWCQAYVTYLNEVVDNAGTKVMYYNIYQDRKDNSELYQKVVEILKNYNEDMMRYDNDGNPRIYVPLILFVNQGELLAFDDETCMEDSSVIEPKDYWTEEKVQALKERLHTWSNEIAVLQEENNSHGCDDACVVGEEKEEN